MIQKLVGAILQALSGSGPVLLVLAGSNGAGKSTFHRRYLGALGWPFVNADDMARNLNPLGQTSSAYEAMAIAEAVRNDLVLQHQNFCMETVLSDTQGSKLAFFRRARGLGYRFVLIHIRIDSRAVSEMRVQQRVRNGGHDVPRDKLIKRFPRTAANVAKALRIADLGMVVDNSSAEEPYRLVEIWVRGRRTSRADAANGDPSK